MTEEDDENPSGKQTFRPGAKNQPAAIIDLVLILYAFAFQYIYPTIDGVPVLVAAAGLVIPAMVLPWYLGFVFARYAGARESPSFLKNPVTRKTLLIASLVSLLSFLIWSAVQYHESGFANWIIASGFICFAFGSSLGIVTYAGYNQAPSRGKSPGHLSADENRDWLQVIAISVVLGCMIPLIAGLAMADLALPQWSFVLGAVSFLIAWLSLVTYYFVEWHATVMRTRAYRVIRSLLVYFLFPLIMATGFAFFDATTQTAVFHSGSRAPALALLLIIVPIRIVLALSPPLRVLNLCFGVLAIVVLFRNT